MEYVADLTLENMLSAVSRAKAASVVSMTFVYLTDDRAKVIATDDLPVAILERGGFVAYVDDVGRWVPNEGQALNTEDSVAA